LLLLKIASEHKNTAGFRLEAKQTKATKRLTSSDGLFGEASEIVQQIATFVAASSKNVQRLPNLQSVYAALYELNDPELIAALCAIKGKAHVVLYDYFTAFGMSFSSN